MTVDARFRALVPESIVLPCEHVDSVGVLPIVVEDLPDGKVRVAAPGLDDVKSALAIGSAELVRSYCEMWTRFLALARSGIRRDEP